MTTLAEIKCAQHGWSFEETFRHQYLIAPKSRDPIAGWQTEVLGDWRVDYCPGLPKTHLTLSNGNIVGIVLGYAIGTDGMMLESRYKLPISTGSANKMASIEAHVARFAGRHVTLLALENEARVYPDPTCSLGPVYNAGRRLLGASTTLVIDRPLIDNPDVPADEVANRKGFYRFGNTADADVRRARSNHYIDLSDFSIHRHWPLSDTLLELGDAEHPELSHQIGEKLALNMSALTGRYKTTFPISGGTDSRLLLAASSAFLDQIDHFFVYHTNWSTSIDCVLAREIAEKMCLPLQVVSRDSPLFDPVMTEDEFETTRAKRSLRNGLEPDTANARSIRAMHLVPESDLVLRGNVGEMTRALRWVRDVFNDPDNAEYALGTLGLTKEAVGQRFGFWEDLFLEWKSTLPKAAMPRIYDLVHTELWMPHTNSLVYMADTRDFMINPFNDRHLIELTMRVPPHARKRRRIINKIINSRMPEISDVQYTTQYMRDIRLKNAT